jgi:hypothetical protein
MFRQVAYDTSSRRERKARHLAVAAHLQSAFADEGEEVAEIIAAHLLDALSAVREDFDTADIRERAVVMLTWAGERADRTGAPAAAANHYVAAAALLEQAATPAQEMTAAGLLERAARAATRQRDWSSATARYRPLPARTDARTRCATPRGRTRGPGTVFEWRVVSMRHGRCWKAPWLSWNPTPTRTPRTRTTGLRIQARAYGADNNPQAASAFDTATKALRDNGSTYHLGIGLLDHAECLRARGETRRARELVLEAESIARHLGAKPVAERAHRLASLPDRVPSEAATVLEVDA